MISFHRVDFFASNELSRESVIHTRESVIHTRFIWANSIIIRVHYCTLDKATLIRALYRRPCITSSDLCTLCTPLQSYCTFIITMGVRRLYIIIYASREFCLRMCLFFLPRFKYDIMLMPPELSGTKRARRHPDFNGLSLCITKRKTNVVPSNVLHPQCAK